MPFASGGGDGDGDGRGEDGPEGVGRRGGGEGDGGVLGGGVGMRVGGDFGTDEAGKTRRKAGSHVTALKVACMCFWLASRGR